MIILKDPSSWIFHAKGNANILLKYAGTDPLLQGQLLRLRQSNEQYTTTQVYEHYRTIPDDLSKCRIRCQLVKVEFKKEECLNDGYGLLMPNLAVNSELIKKERYYSIFKKEEGYTLELKPKWLNSYHDGCRNCTMHKKKYKEEPTICTLDLIRQESIASCCQQMLNEPSFHIPLIEYFQQDSSILKQLKLLQKTIDFDHDRFDVICYQMMLRDVTLFIEIKDRKVESVVITDLDPKWEGKVQEWRKKENKLKQILENNHTLALDSKQR